MRPSSAGVSKVKVYLDGNLNGTAAYIQDIHINSSVPIRIGASEHTYINGAFNGSIKNVMIFNESLDENTIKEIYNFQK